MQTEMSSSPTGGLCLPTGKHIGILTLFQTLVNKKMAKKQLFLVILRTFEGYAQGSGRASEFFVAFDDKAGHNFNSRSGTKNFEKNCLGFF